MWKYPRMVAWFLVLTALLLGSRLVFQHAQMIPFRMDFNPVIVLVPLAGVFWGPAGAWSSLAAMLLGDYLIGSWGELTFFRAAGTFLFALTAQRLWDVPHGPSKGFFAHHPGWGPAFRFLIVSWPGCFLAASWMGLGAEFHRLYPFPYFVSLLLTHHLLFVTLLGVAFYRIVAREMVPQFGAWRDIMGRDATTPPLSHESAVYLWVGSFGACLAGVLAGGLFYRIWPFEPYILGTTCGPLLEVFVIPFLVLQVLGVLGFRIRR